MQNKFKTSHHLSGMPLEFGNQTQIHLIEKLAEPEQIADDHSRRNAAYKNYMREPNRRFSLEFDRWDCPVCKVMNRVRLHISSQEYIVAGDGWDEDEAIDFQPIITPRAYHCHNSRCHLRRLYWRDSKNILWARYVGKYEIVNELEFVSAHDPVKFYLQLNTRARGRTIELFNH